MDPDFRLSQNTYSTIHIITHDMDNVDAACKA